MNSIAFVCFQLNENNKNLWNSYLYQYEISLGSCHIFL